MGLATVLTELTPSWASAMSVRVRMDARSEELLVATPAGEELPRATYRITEQALFNAAAHGKASDVDVTIDTVVGAVIVQVSDNGVGLSDTEMSRGTGFAHIDAWAMIVEGTWTITPGPHGGAILAMGIPPDRRRPELLALPRDIWGFPEVGSDATHTCECARGTAIFGARHVHVSFANSFRPRPNSSIGQLHDVMFPWWPDSLNSGRTVALLHSPTAWDHAVHDVTP